MAKQLKTSVTLDQFKKLSTKELEKLIESNGEDIGENKEESINEARFIIRILKRFFESNAGRRIIKDIVKEVLKEEDLLD